MKRGPGRPRAIAPFGRVTLRSAAEISGVSYEYLQRLALRGDLPTAKQIDGVWTVTKLASSQIKRREPADTERHAVMLRPAIERYATWARASGTRPVSVWLGDLADLESGWRR